MVKQVTRDELVRLRSAGNKMRLVDVLGTESYEKEHIPGAISIPLVELERKAARLLDKNDTVVVYCASFDCKASTTAAEKLSSLGYKFVLDYKGGLKDYKEGGLALEGSLHGDVPCASCSPCSSCD